MEITGVGIDGCRGGWLVCLLFKSGRVNFLLLSQLEQINQHLRTSIPVFIDMPFGLQEKGERQCDKEARRLLGKRRSTIFITPCRPAVFANDYAEACKINQICSGKKISIQAWNITPKIRELDHFLRNNTQWQKAFFESHPELCFASLNNGQILNQSKKTEQGWKQRIRLLQNYLNIKRIDLEQWREKLGRSQIQFDDLLDAAVLSICASLPAEWRQMIPEEIQRDKYGLKMNIVRIMDIKLV